MPIIENEKNVRPTVVKFIIAFYSFEKKNPVVLNVNQALQGRLIRIFRFEIKRDLFYMIVKKGTGMKVNRTPY
ncbi:hypothetical protein [Chryseolinea sp. H1M3-3]|uniref:hypothetical protein n=1 Tax=Chryseolinea sp. H1M3-3 TaxID=3034144 RepID=UPI0023ECFA37|nr:hypothetical protein [Chryseolinea sp. H1M3-3]